MVERAPVSSLPSQYNEFLFAPVGEEASGMWLSVLSALARMNVDPWEEASRLASMPRAIAAKTLAASLSLVGERRWNLSEAELIAARLVRLLPLGGDAEVASPAKPGNIATQTAGLLRQKSYWWVWVGFALAMSFLTPKHETTAGTTTPVTQSSVAPSSNGLDPSVEPATRALSR